MGYCSQIQTKSFSSHKLINYLFIIKIKMFNCYFKSSKEKKSFYQHKKLEMLNYIKDSLERKIASVTASIDVLESQISRDKEPEVTN